MKMWLFGFATEKESKDDGETGVGGEAPKVRAELEDGVGSLKKGYGGALRMKLGFGKVESGCEMVECGALGGGGLGLAKGLQARGLRAVCAGHCRFGWWRWQETARDDVEKWSGLTM